MGNVGADGSSSEGKGDFFKTTRWSAVRKAFRTDTPSATQALSELCHDYWYPLYAYVRRRQYSPEDAQDLTQSFFAHLLETQFFQRADETRGRFRTYLLGSLNHFLANEWDKRKAAKRGGHCFFTSWAELQAEGRYDQEPFHELTAEKLYERRWALTLIDRATEALRREYTRAGEQAVFDALHGLLTDQRQAGSYKEVADRLNVTEDTVRMRLHRLRRRFGELFRQEVAQTVDGESEFDEELRHLFGIWD